MNMVKCYLKAGGIRLSESIASNLSPPRAFFIIEGCLVFGRTSIGIFQRSIQQSQQLKCLQLTQNKP